MYYIVDETLVETVEESIALDEVMRPAIWLCPSPGAAVNSRLGGLPSLPPGLDWPKHRTTFLPLHFLAQIDLAELPPISVAEGEPALLSSGILFFFADIDCELAWVNHFDFHDLGDPSIGTRVLFAEKAGSPTEPPPDLPRIGHYGEDEEDEGPGIGRAVFGSCPIIAYRVETYAQQFYPNDRLDDLAALREFRSLEKALGRKANRVDRVESFNEACRLPMAVEFDSRFPDRKYLLHCLRHQMLGSATNVNGTAPDAHKWGYQILLQIDTDLAVDEEFMFCDMGMIQYWIRPEELAQRRFEAVVTTTEGG